MGWTGINGMVCVDRYLSGMERVKCMCGQVPEWDGKG